METKHSSGPTLVQLQNWMHGIVTDGRGVQNALADSDPGLADLRTEIEETESLDRISRLDIYAQAYYLRFLECMEDDFRRVKCVVGEEAFNELVKTYIAQYPSRSTNLGNVGSHFYDFLIDHPLTREFPILPELARLEDVTQISFWSENVGPFDASGLSTLSERDWDGIKIKLNPSVCWMETFFPVDALWTREDFEADGIPERAKGWTPSPVPRYLLIYRRDYAVHLREADPDEFLLLRLIDEGASLGEITGFFARRRPNEDAAFGAYFQCWIQEGLIQSVE